MSLALEGKCPDEISKGKKISNLLCIKGANGSGKTNVLKILAFIHDFCCNSWSNKPDEKIVIRSFFYNEGPINIYCEFEINETKYLYELSLTEDKVISESISRTIQRQTLVFKRKNDKITYCIKEFEQLKNIKLRSNASIFSTANQYEIKSTSKIYNFFDKISSNVNWYVRNESKPEIGFLSKFYKESPEFLSAAIEVLKKCDLGINTVEIHSRKDEDGGEIFFPIFKHTAKNVKYNFLTYAAQSSGTKTIFETFPLYYIVLTQGGVLALDELDKDLHPHILPKIIDLFLDDEKNPNNAQLIFTVHNTEIIDKLTKYRVYLVNKEDSESFGYRLDEIGGELLRNDRSISNIYDKGKLGGVPLL